jgi:hypothetical protein
MRLDNEISGLMLFSATGNTDWVGHVNIIMLAYSLYSLWIIVRFVLIHHYYDCNKCRLYVYNFVDSFVNLITD